MSTYLLKCLMGILMGIHMSLSNTSSQKVSLMSEKQLKSSFTKQDIQNISHSLEVTHHSSKIKGISDPLLNSSIFISLDEISNELNQSLPIAAEMKQFRQTPTRNLFSGRLMRRPNTQFLETHQNPIKTSLPFETSFYPSPRLHDAEFRFESSSFFHEDCEEFTPEICLSVRFYPVREILGLLSSNRRIGNDFLTDALDQRGSNNNIDGFSSIQKKSQSFAHILGNRRQETQNIDSHRDLSNEDGFLCPSKIEYGKPKRGKTSSGDWKYIVNVEDYTQTLRMEKCLLPGDSCSYVSHHYGSQCSQVYNYHRLLSWSKERGLHMDIYKIPSCCSCHIMGYSYLYPPLSKTKTEGISPEKSFESNHLAHINQRSSSSSSSHKTKSNLYNSEFLTVTQIPKSQSNPYPIRSNEQRNSGSLFGQFRNSLDFHQNSVQFSRRNNNAPINYAYHPIIDFFDNYSTSKQN